MCTGFPASSTVSTSSASMAVTSSPHGVRLQPETLPRTRVRPCESVPSAVRSVTDISRSGRSATPLGIEARPLSSATGCSGDVVRSAGSSASRPQITTFSVTVSRARAVASTAMSREVCGRITSPSTVRSPPRQMPRRGVPAAPSDRTAPVYAKQPASVSRVAASATTCRGVLVAAVAAEPPAPSLAHSTSP